jgi:hypothetical protein
MEWTTRETSNRHRTRRESQRDTITRDSERTGEPDRRVSLPPPRQTSTPPHTHAPPLTKFTNPPEAQKFPSEGKIQSEIQRSKSVRPQGAPPNPSRIPQIPAEIPQSSVLAAALRPVPPASCRSRCRGFPPEGFVSLSLSPPYCRHRLARPTLHRGPSSAREAGAPPAEIHSRPEAAALSSSSPPPRSSGTRVAWGGDPPGRGSIPLRSVVSNPSMDCSKDSRCFHVPTDLFST